MAAPRREDYDTIIRDLRLRLDRLERAQRAPSIFLPDGNTPATPVDGGAVYVESGVLKYIGSSGTDTVVAPA